MVRRRLNWQLLRTSTFSQRRVDFVFVTSVELATDVHQRNVLDVVVSSFLWQDLNWQICHRLDVRDVAVFFLSLFPQIPFTHVYSKFPISSYLKTAI